MRGSVNGRRWLNKNSSSSKQSSADHLSISLGRRSRVSLCLQPEHVSNPNRFLVSPPFHGLNLIEKKQPPRSIINNISIIITGGGLWKRNQLTESAAFSIRSELLSGGASCSKLASFAFFVAWNNYPCTFHVHSLHTICFVLGAILGPHT